MGRFVLVGKRGFAPAFDPTSRRVPAGIGFAPLVGLIAALSPVQAQTIAPSQVTPQNLRPLQGPNNAIILSRPSGLEAPAGSEKLDVALGDVVIDGAFAELASATQALLAPIEGRRVTIAEVFSLAAALERAYAAAGYVLARVVVPPQKLVDRATLRIVVIDGFIEAVDVAQVPERVRTVVAQRTASLVGRRHVRLAEIERCLLIAGDVPGLRLTSTLARGSQDGGTRLVLEGTHRLVTGSLGTDDRLDRSLGTWQLKGTLAINSAFMAGEQVYGTAGSVADPARAFEASAPLRVYGGGAVVPLGHDGLTINPEYIYSATSTDASAGAPASRGTFERFALRGAYPLIRVRSETLNLVVSSEYIAQRVEAPDFGIALNRDHYGVVRAGFDYGAPLPWGAALQTGASLSQGTGGRRASDAIASGVPLSRQGAGPDFTKLVASIRVAQPLPGALRLDVIGNGQVSFGKPMLRSEQFSLDGVDALSAFAAGTFSVDQGATLRGELGRPFVMAFDATRTSVARATFVPYLLAAAGRGELVAPTSVEQKMIDAASLGFGVRGAFEFADDAPGASLGLELARQYSDVMGLRQGWRCTVNGAVLF